MCTPKGKRKSKKSKTAKEQQELESVKLIGKVSLYQILLCHDTIMLILMR